MKYLDVTVFIAAAIEPGKVGDSCRGLLRRIRGGEIDAATSALTWDEVAYVVSRHRGRQVGLDAALSLLGVRHLRILSIDPQLLRDADRLAREHGLRPRDALHAACARRAGANAIVTEDRDFDRLPGVAREWV